MRVSLMKSSSKRTCSSAQTSVRDAQQKLADAQEALAKGQAGGDKLALANAQLAVQTATVALAKAQDDKTTLVAGADQVDLATAQADVDKKQLAVADAQTALTARNSSPSFDGTVLQDQCQRRRCQVYATTMVLSVANLKNLQVVASVDETTIRRLSAGQVRRICFDAFPGQTFSGKVLAVPLQGTLQNDVMVYEVPLSLEGR